MALWALFYATAAAAAPVADGLVDHASAVVLHVEDADGGHCPLSHAPESCQICHLAQGLRAVPTPAPALAVADGRDIAQPVCHRIVAPAALEFLAGHSSRAPPALG